MTTIGFLDEFCTEDIYEGLPEPDAYLGVPEPDVYRGLSSPVKHNDVPEYFNVHERTKFYLKVQKCEDIAQLTDSFISRKDLALLVSEDFFHQSFIAYRYDKASLETIFIKSAIKETVLSWIKLIQPGKCSTKCTTSDIEELLDSVPHHRLIHYLPDNFAIHGKTITNFSIRKATVKNRCRPNRLLQRDVIALLWIAGSIITEKYGITYDILNKRIGMAYNNISMAKRLCTWKEVERGLRIELKLRESRHAYLSKEDIKWIKAIWLDPKMVNIFNKS